MIGKIRRIIAAALEPDSKCRKIYIRGGTDRGALPARFFVSAWLFHIQQVLTNSNSKVQIIPMGMWCKFHGLATHLSEACVRGAGFALGWTAPQVNEYVRLYVCAIRNRLYFYFVSYSTFTVGNLSCNFWIIMKSFFLDLLLMIQYLPVLGFSY